MLASAAHIIKLGLMFPEEVPPLTADRQGWIRCPFLRCYCCKALHCIGMYMFSHEDRSTVPWHRAWYIADTHIYVRLN